MTPDAAFLLTLTAGCILIVALLTEGGAGIG